MSSDVHCNFILESNNINMRTHLTFQKANFDVLGFVYSFFRGVLYILLRHKICFIAVDDEAEAEFIFFNRVGRDLFGLP